MGVFFMPRVLAFAESYPDIFISHSFADGFVIYVKNGCP
jgi:hypothetical protein